MKVRAKNIFTTVRAEGAILPTDLLQRIVDNDKDLDGLTPAAYHLLEGEKLNEAINRSWSRLRGAWASFQGALERLPESDVATKVTRDRILLPLFQELGYGRLTTTRAIEIEGKAYPISHLWQNTPIHLVGYRVDLDKRTAGVAGAARSSPHSLVQEFLNRSDDHLWAFVSNGRRLRILRDNASLTRQAYVEFDLEAMMAGEVYADFVLLWLLCHQSRVEAEKPEQCWLEVWSKTANDQGKRALDALRDGVESAISSLGQGFLTHSANRTLRQKLQSGELATQDYYRQLLRLVYRLLFLFVAEDRELLLDPNAELAAKDRYTLYYSTTRLRSLAEKRRGTRHSDLFHGLRLVMEKLSSRSGCPALALPALNGFLWSEEATSDLEVCQIANLDLLKAVRALAFITDQHGRRAVDYKNLQSEELGSVYESLLELQPELNISAGTFELKTVGGNERKTTGSYYTPDSLVQCLLDSALDPVLDEATRQPDPEAAILALKVCDPACGSGHFLIAAAHRIAKRLAAVRTGDEEPAPEARHTAIRDVIGYCIYGVDINPMAVELCKVALCMEAVEPGKPLPFLEHHVWQGNSLLGATPKLISQGIPNEAFKPIEGDNKSICSQYRKQNKKEREKQQLTLVDPKQRPWEWLGDLAEYTPELNPWQQLEDIAARQEELDNLPGETLEDIYLKQRKYRELLESTEYRFASFRADTWCAAFVIEKISKFDYLITEEVFRKIKQNPLNAPDWLWAEVINLQSQYHFFHWHITFSHVFRVPKHEEEARQQEIGWSGGFDVVLGNPPWERIKIQEKEWFAARNPDIAEAKTTAARRKKIAALAHDDPDLYKFWKEAVRQAEGESHLVRNSQRFPLCGRGDVNTYSIFAETNRTILGSTGRVGCIVPSGIATDDTTKYFFQDLMETGSLVSLYDFENRKNLFDGVGHGRFKFCLLTLTGFQKPAEEGAEFIFFAYEAGDLHEKHRRFTLTAEDIELLNPNTRTCPIFRSKRDAEITKAIYHHAPVLIKEGRVEENPWKLRFSTMFHMSSDSHYFKTFETNLLLRESGLAINSASDIRLYEADGIFLPLYEAKMFHQFDHRYGDYADHPEGALTTHLPDIPAERLEDPKYYVEPRYWVEEWEVERRISNVPRQVVELYQAGKEKQLKDFCAHWLAGYYLNHGNEELGNKILLQLTPILESTMGSMQRCVMVEGLEEEYPLTAEEADIIVAIVSDKDDSLDTARYFIELRCPKWLMGFRDVTNATNERTAIFSLLPPVGAGHKAPVVLLPKQPAFLQACFLACVNSFVFDYVTRQNMGGTSLSYFVLKQLPVLLPEFYNKQCFWWPEIQFKDWVTWRVLELTYTAWDFKHFAQDVLRGLTDTPAPTPTSPFPTPFRWDEDRRFLLRCELDAAYFHLYGIQRDDVDYIMETFPIVKRKDEKAHGHYRTKDTILQIYDAMATATANGQPYQTLLDPPPADPRVAHPPREAEIGSSE